MDRSVPLHLPRRQVTQIGKNASSVPYTTWSRRRKKQGGRKEDESHDKERCQRDCFEEVFLSEFEWGKTAYVR